MGRIYLAENNVQTLIDNIVTNYPFAVGLIIGQLQSSSDKDYILHVVVTPQSDEEGNSDVAINNPTSHDDINPQHVALHARQAQRMLTGGLDIIGLFSVTTNDELKNSQPKLRQVFYSVFTSLLKNEVTLPVNQHKTRLLLQICPASKKLTCRTYDVSDAKCAASPAEWKCQRMTNGFLALSSTFSLDVTFPVACSRLGDSLENQIMAGLLPVCKSVWASRALINGQLLASESPLATRTSPSPASRGGRKRQQEATTNEETFVIDLLQEMCPVLGPAASEVADCGAMMRVRGTITSRAYINAKSSVSDGIEALKTDIVRSIVSRCELLCEDLLQAEEEQDDKVLYELPVRVFVNVRDTGVELCDYLFQDETTDDSLKRFQELVGLDVDTDALEQTVETLPVDEDLVRPVESIKKRLLSGSDDRSVRRPATSTLCNLIGIASTLTVATIAALVSYWYSAQ